MHTQPLPKSGDVVKVRQRLWLVNDTAGPEFPEKGDATLVQLSCLDPDAAGERLEVLWQVELSPEIIPDEPSVLPESPHLDEPRLFGVWLNALRWECVTSTDKRLLQAPFRAGIDLKPYQLEPLRKALELPRVNLFIADDVGLGKTIEAGIILEELLLRQRIDRVLVVAPPAVTLQWQEELEQRFGIHFEVYDRDFIAARRRERGWGINPWTTHPYFIVSTALLRGQRTRKRGGTRTPHLELLLNALGPRADRTLLILDEAHHAAPSSGTQYAIDSRTTRAIRQLAGRFEHRLFLSATPHNGHSNAFSALLELLDPQRFTRGVKVSGVKELEPIMVRRLKRDLRSEVGGLPERRLVDHVLPLPPNAVELTLGHLLARYEDAYRSSLAGLPRQEQAARGLVLINLHKRLLSSVYAFARTLKVHADAVEKSLKDPAQRSLPLSVLNALMRRDDGASLEDTQADEALTDEQKDQQEDELITAATLAPSQEALELLQSMRTLAAIHKDQPDVRLRHLAAWIQTHLCPGGQWNERRVVVFTEYDDTLRWMLRLLPALLKTGDIQGRFESYHGGLSEARRDALKRAFNTSPAAHPIRVLLATDAAREGINLQAHCSDLFHFDLPWNPSRVEQRNGRIDRTLQPAPQVFCHYFDLPDRPEDRVLTHMIRKLKVITEELGSLSDVLSARLSARMEQGIRTLSLDDVEQYLTPEAAALEAARELEGRYADDARLLRGDLATLERQYERSKRAMGYEVNHLREAVELGLQQTLGEGLTPREPKTFPPSFDLPRRFDPTWESVLAPLREPLPDDAPRWKTAPLKPVAFQAAHRLDAETVQLHLGHPLVKRLLARFRAQGFATHDLSRVTLLEAPGEVVRRVMVFGKLALFGHGATRLHEEIIVQAARWGGEHDAPQPYKADANRNAAELLFRVLELGPSPHPLELARTQARACASRDFASLWSVLQSLAVESEQQARTLLSRRGDEEATALETLLLDQTQRIHATLNAHLQLPLPLSRAATQEREQFERDQRFMQRRLDELEQERLREPPRLRRNYEVVLSRFEPLGMVYLWPGL
ncbi:MAG: DISARM system SNF2-like helicase DrmD [Myxococcota bacterium]